MNHSWKTISLEKLKELYGVVRVEECKVCGCEKITTRIWDDFLGRSDYSSYYCRGEINYTKNPGCLDWEAENHINDEGGMGEFVDTEVDEL